MADEFINQVIERKLISLPHSPVTAADMAKEVIALVREHDANKGKYEISASDILKADIAASAERKHATTEITERFARQRTFGFMAGDKQPPAVQPPRVSYISGDGVISTQSLSVVAVELDKKGMSDAAALVRFLISNDAANMKDRT